MRPQKSSHSPQALTGIPIKKQSWLKKKQTNKTKTKNPQYHFNSRESAVLSLSEILSFGVKDLQDLQFPDSGTSVFVFKDLL